MTDGTIYSMRLQAKMQIQSVILRCLNFVQQITILRQKVEKQCNSHGRKRK